MTRTHQSMLCAAILFGGLAGASSAQGQMSAPATSDTPMAAGETMLPWSESPQPVAQSAPAAPDTTDTTGVISQTDLSEISGGADTKPSVLSEQQLTGITSGNTFNVGGTLTSGGVNFDASALNGFNGVGNFVINTGANNTLQGAINISIVTTPSL